MTPIYESCTPRREVLRGDLEDAIFGADFGHVIEGTAPDVYRDPDTFFRNTHPAAPLRKLVTTVFDRLASPDESGAIMRLSTGYGGGKTHTLIALWHLARNIGNTAMGTELLAAAGRPNRIAVAGVDGDKAGSDVLLRHADLVTHSLWGELAYQLGGPANYAKVRDVDNPETVPDAALIREILPKDRPVLILLDEIVLYMLKLNHPGRRALLAFLNMLMSEIAARRRAVLVITDPATQVATEAEARDLEDIAERHTAVQALDDHLARRATDFDPIGGESAQVIIRRLFERRDEAAAHTASAEYSDAYRRIAGERPDLLPPGVTGKEYAESLVTCYPFHPRLLETAKERLGAIQDFQKSRGVLRLFARIIRDVWESRANVPLITAGDLDWSSERIRADLLHRLNKDVFAAPADADVCRHAVELDEKHSTDIHRRVASALLLESLAPNGSMDRRDLTLAVLRPDEVGHEPGEALDRLMSVCWHTYKKEAGDKFYFHYEPNVNKLIEETAERISAADAQQAVFTWAQQYFGGSIFELVTYPHKPAEVSDSAKLKLVLADSEELAQRVCDYEDDSDPDAKRPRRFRNAIFGIAPAPEELQKAIRECRWRLAAEQVQSDYKDNREIRKQLETLKPSLDRRARIAAARAFCRVVFQGRPSVSLEEKYMISQEPAVPTQNGQQNLKRFLDDKNLVYQADDAIDVDLLLDEIVPGATPSPKNEGAFTASSIHERALSSEKLRLMMDVSPVRRSIIEAVNRGKLVVRLPSGDVYDKDGCVYGPEDDRKRNSSNLLSTLKLEADVLVAPADAPCVKQWTKLSEPSDQPPLVDVTDVPPPDRVTASDWDTAIEYAAGRPVYSVKLTTPKPEAAKRLIGVAQPFGAPSPKLTVRIQGELKDGGSLNFLADDVKVNSAVKPIDRALEFARALGEDTKFKAQVSLDFGKDGEKGKQGCFEQARHMADSDVSISAEFGKE